MIFTTRILDQSQLAIARGLIGGAAVSDGRRSAFGAAGKVKNNLQVALDERGSAQLATLVVDALSRSQPFFRQALPSEISAPMINCHAPGMHYGPHYDAPVFMSPAGQRIRADLSATLFVTPPDQYEGGELTILRDGQAQEIKLAAGQLVVYPASLLHEVRPVRSGTRHAIVFWVQSMIQDKESRELFYRLDDVVERISRRIPEGDEVRDLVGVFSGLGRLWLKP